MEPQWNAHMKKRHKENMRKVVDETVKILMFVHLNRDKNCQASPETAQNTKGKACPCVRNENYNTVVSNSIPAPQSRRMAQQIQTNK